MYYYFSSDFPSVVKINGAFLGVISNEIKFCDIEDYGAFIEICSLSPTDKNLNFLLTEEFLNSPPQGYSVTDLKGGFLIKSLSLAKGDGFNILSQEKNDYCAVTVFTDNGLKVSIETANDFFADEITLRANSATTQFFNMGSNFFVAIQLLSQKKYLLVYDLTSKINKLFFGEIFSFSLDGALTTIEKRQDIAKHVITTVWKYDKVLIPSSVSIACSESFNVDKLINDVIPYAFLEELLVGGDVKIFLTEETAKNADKLTGFFGKFLGIMPPPKFRNENEIGLVYKQSENKYFVDYFTFELQDNKICNIKRSAN